MKKVTVHVDGKDASLLPQILANKSDYYYKIVKNGVTIFAYEDYYFRVNAYPMTIIVLSPKDCDHCEVELLTGGGGGEGIFGITWGAEKSSNNRVTSLLMDLCKEYGWKMTEENEKI